MSSPAPTRLDDAPWHTFEQFDPSIWPRDTIRWTYLVSPETGAPTFEMGICRLDPGGIHVLHHHVVRNELYYVISGAATVTIADTDHVAAPGDAFHIPAGTTHGFVNDGDEVFEIVYVYDRPPGFRRPDTFWDA